MSLCRVSFSWYVVCLLPLGPFLSLVFLLESLKVLELGVFALLLLFCIVGFVLIYLPFLRKKIYIL